MRHLYSNQENLAFYLDSSDILYIKFSQLDISSESATPAIEKMISLLGQYPIKSILADIAIATGTLGAELLVMLRDWVYPELIKNDIEKIGIVIPVNDEALKSLGHWKDSFADIIPVKNFLYPSGAKDWFKS